MAANEAGILVGLDGPRDCQNVDVDGQLSNCGNGRANRGHTIAPAIAGMARQPTDNELSPSPKTNPWWTELLGAGRSEGPAMFYTGDVSPRVLPPLRPLSPSGRLRMGEAKTNTHTQRGVEERRFNGFGLGAKCVLLTNKDGPKKDVPKNGAFVINWDLRFSRGIISSKISLFHPHNPPGFSSALKYSF